jgi:hypothetical protein
MNELNPLQALLECPLDTDNHVVMAKQLADAESYQTRVSRAYREAERALNELKGKLINPSLSSEDKRKVDLNAKTAQANMDVNILADLASSIQTRISLGQSLLKNVNTEMKTGLR